MVYAPTPMPAYSLFDSSPYAALTQCFRVASAKFLGQFFGYNNVKNISTELGTFIVFFVKNYFQSPFILLTHNLKKLTRRLRNPSARQSSLTHDLRIACATLRSPGFSKTVPNALRGSLRTAYATLPPAVPFQ